MPGATTIPTPEPELGDRVPPKALNEELQVLEDRLSILAREAEEAICKPRPAEGVIVRISKTAMFGMVRIDVAFDRTRYVHVATLPLAEMDPGSIYEAVAYRDGRTRELEERPKTAHWPR